MSLPAQARTALETFAQPQSWEQRARLLMQWGDRLPPLSDAEKSDEHLVHGCESKVWLTGEI
ncbi:sufE protein, partial [Pseudomonas syringae pv. actinidiae ICMP 19079]